MACSHDCGFVDFGDAEFGGLLDRRGAIAVWSRHGEAMFDRWQDFVKQVTGQAPNPNAEATAILTTVFEGLTKRHAIAA